MVATPPEHRARPPRRRGTRSRRRHRRDRDREAAGSSSSASRRRRRDRGDPSRPSSPAKKPRLRSEVGLVRGCAWRFEPFTSPSEDNAVLVPAADGVAAAPAPAPASSSSAAAPAADNCEGMVFAPEPAPPKGGAGAGAGAAASSSSAHPPPAPSTVVLFACQMPLPPPPPLSSHAAPRPLFFSAAAAAPPPIMPASTPCATRTKAIAIPSTSRHPYAAAIPTIPAIPPFFPIIAPPPEQPAADADELRRAKVQRYAGLIAKKQQETDERYRNLLRSGQALPALALPEPPPAPKPKPAVDKETLRRLRAARNAAKRRSREALLQLERKAEEAALFVQMAPAEHLREIGIDREMERVVSPERPRDGNGVPVVSPEHPFSPVEKLGFFLKPEYVEA